MEDREVGIAPRPGPVLPARVRSLAQRVEGLGSLAQPAEDAGDVVHDHGVVRTQGHGEVRLAQGVLGPIHVGVAGREEGAAPGVLGDLLQVLFQHLDPLQHDVAQGVLLPESAESVLDRDVHVVVLYRGGDRRLRHLDDFLVLSRGEERAPQQVVGTFGVALARHHVAHATRGFVVLAFGVQDPGLRNLDLGGVPAERARPLAGRLAALDPGVRTVEVLVELGAGEGDRGVGERKSGIERRRVLEQLEREIQVLARQPAGVALPAQVQVVGLKVVRRLGGERRLLLRRELHAQGFGDLAGDLVLDVEHVRHLAVVPLGPQQRVRLRVHELGADPEPVSGTADAPGEHESGLQLLSHVGGGHRLVPEGKHRGPRHDLQALDLRQLRDDVLGDAVAQVLVLFRPGEVLEVEDGHRLVGGLRPPAGTRIGELRRAPAAGVGVALQAQEVRLEVGGRLVAQATILLERLAEDAVELSGQRRIGLADRRGLAVEDRVEDDGRGVARERQHPRRRLVEDRPQGEEVRSPVGELPARLLRRHVRHRAQRRARARELVRLHRSGRLGVPRRRGAGVLDLREAEVEDLGLPARDDEDVGRLQVAVHDPLRVRRLQRVRDLDPEVQQRPEVERPPPDPVREGFPLEQLHGDEVLPLVVVDLVDRADSRVIEGGGSAGLALEALERGRVLGHFRGQELERDVPAELRVLGLIDDAHAPAAELGGDPVVGDGLADHGLLSSYSVAGVAGYSFSKSGSPWRIARSGSRRAQLGSLKPASQALRRAPRHSGLRPSCPKVQATL